ncbi:MAG: hypothetical protein JXA06_02335 [Bacteroidetes bacterium]|nr:hypothetical protein [Bacteroidota bacterium]
MTNILQAITNSQICDNHILYSLLFFLHSTDPDFGHIDVDTPISQFDEDLFIVATSFTELHLGIDIPDAMLTDKSKTLRQFTDEIRVLPHLTDTEFQKKLLLDIALWKSLVEVN